MALKPPAVTNWHLLRAQKRSRSSSIRFHCRKKGLERTFALWHMSLHMKFAVIKSRELFMAFFEKANAQYWRLCGGRYGLKINLGRACFKVKHREIFERQTFAFKTRMYVIVALVMSVFYFYFWTLSVFYFYFWNKWPKLTSFVQYPKSTDTSSPSDMRWKYKQRACFIFSSISHLWKRTQLIVKAGSPKGSNHRRPVYYKEY